MPAKQSRSAERRYRRMLRESLGAGSAETGVAAAASSAIGALSMVAGCQDRGEAVSHERLARFSTSVAPVAAARVAHDSVLGAGGADHRGRLGCMPLCRSARASMDAACIDGLRHDPRGSKSHRGYRRRVPQRRQGRRGAGDHGKSRGIPRAGHRAATTPCHSTLRRVIACHPRIARQTPRRSGCMWRKTSTTSSFSPSPARLPQVTLEPGGHRAGSR